MAKSNVFTALSLFAIFGIVHIHADLFLEAFLDDNNPKYQRKPLSVVVDGNRKIYKFGSSPFEHESVYSVNSTIYESNVVVKGGYPNAEGRVTSVFYAEITIEADNDAPEVKYFEVLTGDKTLHRRVYWRYTITARNTKRLSYEVKVYE